MKIERIILFFFFLTLFSCTEKVRQQAFDAVLSEPCMIVNYEQDNTLEGTYLTVESMDLTDSVIQVRIPENFFINAANCTHWVVGWGDDQPLFDAGVENIREIATTTNNKGTFRLGRLLRGSGFPHQGQRIVFWNRNPSGFINETKQPVLDPGMWPEFAGNSISFAAVEYDSLLSKWIMLVNECDTSKIQIYAAMSDDLVHWEVANQGRPILKANDFKKFSWAGKDRSGSISQTPYVSDIVRYQHQWVLFLDGYSADGKRHIGTAVSETSLLGPYKITEKPALSPGKGGTWNEEACFYAKVEKYQKGFIMFFDGRNSDGLECTGMATSTDLRVWHEAAHNPVISQHSGWRSSPGTSEPAYIEIRNDTILLMIAGAKTFKMGAWHHYITRRMYLDRSGNVDDAQLGIYQSVDGGKTFTAHKNNPVFVNDYANAFENEHLGANFCLIKTDSMTYLFYQAKSSDKDLKYNLMLRQKK